MPYINTPNGRFKYHTRPLFPGVKQIDKAVSKVNLFKLKEIFDKIGIEFLISFGTLLGAVREADFITHDEDIDLVVKEEYRNLFLQNLNYLRNEGFELVRFDRRCLYSLMRNGEYIDLYFYHYYDDETWISAGCVMCSEFMQTPEDIEFLGMKFKTHSNYIGLLECEYGPNWKTPVKWNNYMLPKWKQKLLMFKEHLKDLLPDKLYLMLAKKNQEKSLAKTRHNIEVYRKRITGGEV